MQPVIIDISDEGPDDKWLELTTTDTVIRVHLNAAELTNLYAKCSQNLTTCFVLPNPDSIDPGKDKQLFVTGAATYRFHKQRGNRSAHWEFVTSLPRIV